MRSAAGTIGGQDGKAALVRRFQDDLEFRPGGHGLRIRQERPVAPSVVCVGIAPASDALARKPPSVTARLECDEDGSLTVLVRYAGRSP
jgi:hypothetical protein